MPELRTRRQQPKPVNPQVPVPNDFPDIPQSILDRFPEAADWQKRLNEFWAKANQAMQEFNTQTAAQVNSTVVWTVDSFLIYTSEGNEMPMFALDGTGIRLGNVLVINTPGRKVYIGAGTYQSADTPFYIDTDGKFSLGANLTWNPATSTLNITGTIIATTGSIGGFDIGTDYIRDAANSMGLASTVTGGDDVRFWAGATFANRATAPFFVTEAGNITANNATIVGTVSGRSTATLAAAIDSGGTLVTDLINARLNTSAKTMLSDFSFGAADFSGALKSGTITWSTATGALTGGSGVLVFRGGIIGAAAGVATFTIDATTGAATFAGALSAPTGNIGGFNLDADYIRDVANSFGLASTVTGGDDIRFWAGNTFANRATAPFRVSEAGVVTATSGTIGGWTLSSTTLTGGSATLDSAGVLTLGTSNDVVIASAADATYRLWIGNATAASAPFRVTKAGVLTATGATITGTITASAGAIGGFDVGTDYIRDVANSMGMASTVTAGDDVRFWAGATFANRATAPFRVTEAGVLVASNATITGTITSTVGTIGGFTLGATTLSAGSGSTYISLNAAGSIFLGVADGVNPSTYMTPGSVLIRGYAPNLWVDASNGSIAGGTWTYTSIYNFSINWQVSSAGLATFLGGLTINGAGSTQTKIDTTGNVLIGSAGVLKVNAIKVVGAQAAAEADISLITSLGLLYSDGRPDIEANFTTLNTKINNILAKIRTHGLFAT